MHTIGSPLHQNAFISSTVLTQGRILQFQLVNERGKLDWHKFIASLTMVHKFVEARRERNFGFGAHAVIDHNANWSIEEILQNSNHVSQSACTARVNAKPKYGIVREGFAHANIAEKPGLS